MHGQMDWVFAKIKGQKSLVGEMSHFGSKLRAMESSMPLRKLIDSGAE